MKYSSDVFTSFTWDRYDKKDTSRILLQDVQLVTAMGPPGDGKNPVTSRFLRHFNNISITKFSDDTMTKIFGSIVNHCFRVSVGTDFNSLKL